MRFSTLAISLLSGLSVFKGVIASPIQPAALAKRDTIEEVVNTLKSSVVSILSSTCMIRQLTQQAGPVNTLKNPEVTALEAQSALQSIVNAISAANAAVPGSGLSAKRSIQAADVEARSTGLSERQADDLEIVGRVLAEIITDLVEAIAGLADDLKGLPLIVSLLVHPERF
jgi:hypothetical protein